MSNAVPQAPMAATNQGHVSSNQEKSLLSGHIASLLNPDSPTITSTLASSSPETSVREVAERLFGVHRDHGHHSHHLSDSQDVHGSNENEEGGMEKLMNKLHLKKREDTDEGIENPAEKQWRSMKLLNQEEIEEFKQFGQWGNETPSDLFLNIYAQSLLPLNTDPLKDLVSPSLIGSCGVIPLSIISVIPDIIEHHADIIVRAQHEIFLATNFWEASSAAKTITDAFKELSRRVIERKGKKVVIKMMYDRGNPQQVIDPHQSVDVKTYTGDKVKLPLPEEIPGCTLEVQNYHQPPVGTFHAKYMVVDRQIAILNSNNIQDRVNVEMMTHIEGPIVQSLYDMALISWWKSFNPPLPLIGVPPIYDLARGKDAYEFGTDHPVISTKGDLNSAAEQSRKVLADHHAQAVEEEDGKKEIWDKDNQNEADRVDNQFTSEESINKHLNSCILIDTGNRVDSTDNNPPPNASAFRPVVLHSPHNPFPIAMVNRPPRGRPGHGDVFVPQDQAWLAGFKFAKKNVFIQTPTFNALPVVEAALDACRRGILVQIYADLGFNDEGELLPFQGGTNQMVATDMYSRLSDEYKKNLEIYWYTGKDQKTPLNAMKKSRNCHVKLMIVDEEIGIQGNGNQDTQSWFHSQEINILIDSKIISKEWREAIDSNQNTLHYGKVSQKDGIWRDENGKTLPGEKKPPKGPMKSLVGVKGAIQRVRGEGGF
ncbi:uncharacterized protein I206_103064 [Kwoniella pini CBS 10737]|uniref:PLD phosphodiesterase domain-containing protein n=1 Tax=Kwoniella pini CBS 10737 TaxID=1296096 RepID=A0A1B9IAQ4_9TREE|nr:uncharacterized protein I206_01932 [Kwoniella pini CBS 10737]OCF52639.1 hypothetical protein I206_01932 [Kwoniella pini CBS 10737]